MSKTQAAREAVTARLLEHCPRVFFDHSVFPGGPEYPYIVYLLEEVTMDYGTIQCDLEVNVLDQGGDTGQLEALCDDIQAALDHWLYLDENVQFETYPEKRQRVELDDRNQTRRRMTFTLRLNERS